MKADFYARKSLFAISALSIACIVVLTVAMSFMGSFAPYGIFIGCFASFWIFWQYGKRCGLLKSKKLSLSLGFSVLVGYWLSMGITHMVSEDVLFGGIPTTGLELAIKHIVVSLLLAGASFMALYNMPESFSWRDLLPKQECMPTMPTRPVHTSFQQLLVVFICSLYIPATIFALFLSEIFEIPFLVVALCLVVLGWLCNKCLRACKIRSLWPAGLAAFLGGAVGIILWFLGVALVAVMHMEKDEVAAELPFTMGFAVFSLIIMALGIGNLQVTLLSATMLTPFSEKTNQWLNAYALKKHFVLDTAADIETVTVGDVLGFDPAPGKFNNWTIVLFIDSVPDGEHYMGLTSERLKGWTSRRRRLRRGKLIRVDHADVELLKAKFSPAKKYWYYLSWPAITREVPARLFN